jgi:hypothetical protein
MSGQIATPLMTTIVKVSAKLADGQEIEQDFSINHPSGIPDGQIVSNAFQIFKQVGGFLKDIPGHGLEFYMASKVEAPIKFEIKNVLLVGQDQMPAAPVIL